MISTFRLLRRSSQLSYLMFSYFGTIKKINLPDLGEKIKEATVKKWHVKIGDQVDEFQPLADVATDKLFTQIPSSFKGKVHKQFHKEEDLCQVGELFIEIEVEDSATSQTVKSQEVKKQDAPKPAQAQNQQTITTATQQQTEKQQYNNDAVLATPATRSLAKEKNINLKFVKGTGRDGRVLKEDIVNYINGSTAKADPVQQQQTQQKKESKAPAGPKGPTQAPQKFTTQTVKLTDYQKGMQKSMTIARQIPHLYLCDEYDLTELAKVREQFVKQQQKITFMTIFMKAFSMSLNDYPMLNSYYDAEKPFEFKQIANHNISFALDSPKGLVVPNIKNCNNLSIFEIQKELNKIKKLAEAGTLGQNELFDGSICISNIGTIGGTYAGPLIFPPQVCIVALGKVQILPRYINNELKPRKIMNVSFGCDHRLIDGATITRFSNKWKDYLENPSTMLLHMK